MSETRPPVPETPETPEQRRQGTMLRRARVARLTRQGLNPGEIAARLGIATRMVYNDLRAVRRLISAAAVESIEHQRAEHIARTLDLADFLREKYEESKTKRVQKIGRTYVPDAHGNPTIRGSSVEEIIDERGDVRILEQLTKAIASIGPLVRAEPDREAAGFPTFVPPGGATVLAVPAVAVAVPPPLEAALRRMGQAALPAAAERRAEDEREG